MVHFIRISCFIALLAAFPASAFAQAPAASPQGPTSGTLSDPPPVDETAAAKPVSTAPAPESTVAKTEPFKRSFFFSPSDLLDINKALRGVISGSIVGKAAGVIPQVRTIALQGIYYKTPDNWMIWLNSRKITPGSVWPEEIQEVMVEPHVIHLKWFDIGANAVLKLDMYPGEIYDIVTGVALPDQTSVKLEGGKP